MRKLILSVLAGFGLLTATTILDAYANTAEAGNNMPALECNACDMYNQLQRAASQNVVKKKVVVRKTTKVKKKRTTTVASTGGQTFCVYVLQAQPSALVLRAGAGNTGKGIVAWAPEPNAWKPAVGGVKRKICFNSSAFSGRSAVTLCGATAHSTWRSAHLSEFRRVGTIPANDPACLLGSGACAQLGL